MAQSILANTSIASVGRLINIVLGVLITAFITRLLGPEQYGLYILLLSYGAIIQLVADGGLYLTLTRSISESPKAQEVIISHIVSLRLALLVGAFLVGAIVTLFIPSFQGLLPAFVVMAIGLSLQSLSQLFMGIFQHYQVVWRATLGDLLARVGQLVGVMIVGFYGATMSRMISVFTASLAVAYLIHQQSLPRVSWRPKINWKIWKTTMADSWPLGAMLLLSAVYFRADIVMLSVLRDAEEVGWYGVSFRIMESALFFPAMFGGLLLPRLSEAISEGKDKVVGQYLSEGIRVMAVLSSFALIILLLKGNQVISLIAGQEFVGASQSLKVLGFAMAIIFFGNIFGFALVAMKRPYTLVIMYASLVLVNIILNLAVIPTYGHIGAAWTTVITELLSAGAAGVIVLRTYPAKISGSFIVRLLAVVLLTSVVAYYLPLNLHVIIQGLVALLVFLVTAKILGVISKEQLSLVSEAHDL